MIRKIALACVVLSLTTSCVSKKIYQDLENKYADLKKEHNALSDENGALKTSKNQLELDKANLQTELDKTKSERDQFKQEAEEKGAKVRKGARLQAYGIHTTGLRMKLNNTTEETNKARNTVQIKSSFTLSENSLADAGRKTVYMQVISPDGRVLQTRTSNTVQTEAGTVAYSDKKEIDYNNQQIDMSIFYDLK